jgi:hypothetical protein
VAHATVYVGKATTVDTHLEIGASSVEVNVTVGNEIDQQSVATSTNLNDQLFENIPVAPRRFELVLSRSWREFGLRRRNDNPSISGGSALDNLYVADGVNIRIPALAASARSRVHTAHSAPASIPLH